MATVHYDYIVYQPTLYTPKLHEPNPTSLQLDLTITLQRKVSKHDCVSNTFINNESQSPPRSRTARFDIDLLNDRGLALDIIGSMLTGLGVSPTHNDFNSVVDKIIFMSLDMEKREGSKVMPLRAEITARVIQHSSDIDECMMRRALEESELELERSNYGMVPAKKSSVKEMLKRVIVVDDDDDDDDDRGSKRRRVSREDCLICLEELEGGLDTSFMPCRHCFHSKCIETWLDLSHYCPVCRFEVS